MLVTVLVDFMCLVVVVTGVAVAIVVIVRTARSGQRRLAPPQYLSQSSGQYLPQYTPQYLPLQPQPPQYPAHYPRYSGPAQMSPAFRSAAPAPTPTQAAGGASHAQPSAPIHPPASPALDANSDGAAIFIAAAVTADPYAPPLPPVPVPEQVDLDPPARVVPFTDLAPFDIYLTLGAQSAPQLADLAARAPVLADPVILARMQQRVVTHLSTSAPSDVHPLGLDLSHDIALGVLRRIQATGGSGAIAPSAYRMPLVPLHQALAIAHSVLAPRIAQAFPDALFRGVVPRWSHDATCWIVEAVIAYPAGRKYIVDERMVAYIDKLDGHAWPIEDVQRMRAVSFPVSPLSPPAENAAAGAAQPGSLARGDNADHVLEVVQAIGTMEMGAYEMALAQFDRAIRRGAHDWMAHWGRGRCLIMLGREAEALDALQRAYQLHGDPDIVIPDLCEVLINSDRSAEALNIVDQFLAGHPPQHAIVFARAHALLVLRRYAEAVVACDQALGIARPDADAAMTWSLKGKALANLGRYHEAIAAFDCAVALDERRAGHGVHADNERQQHLAENWLAKSGCLLALKRFSETIGACDRCLALAPASAGALDFKMRALFALERYAEAYDPLSRALLLRPDDAKLLAIKAKLAYLLGRHDEAQETLHRLQAVNPMKAQEVRATLTPSARR